MRCSNCGRENDLGKSFCSSCGKQLLRQTVERDSSAGSVAVIALIVVACFVVAVATLTSLNKKAKVEKESVVQMTTINTAEAEQGDDEWLESQETIDEENSDYVVYTVVEDPLYREFTNAEFALSAVYPSHFKVIDEFDDSILFSAEDPNGAAVIKIYAYKNLGTVLLSNIVDELYKNTEADGGRILDKTVSGTEFYCKTKYNKTIFCTKGILLNGNLCCFDFGYAEFEEHVYKDYYNHMATNFLVKNKQE